jgi:hypothetical protein
MLAAYTAQFGNGVSGTISVEQARVRGISRFSAIYVPGAGFGPFVDGGIATGVSEYPDLVGNIRIDQAWGSWLVAGALHVNRGQYLGPFGANTLNGGAPDSKMGWAVTTGFIWNLPMIAPGDRLSAGVVYSVGAIGYASVTPSGSTWTRFNGASYAAGFWEDAVYSPTNPGSCGPFGNPFVLPNTDVRNGLTGCGDLQLTTAWSASAAFEHLWTPALRTSIYGSYVNVSHNNAGNFIICNSGGMFGAFGNAPIIGGVFQDQGCNADWSSWNIGSRTQWEPVKGLVMGVDVIYNKLNGTQPNFNNAVVAAPGGGLPTTSVGFDAFGRCIVPITTSGVPCYRATDQDAVTTTLRIQRDFLP